MLRVVSLDGLGTQWEELVPDEATIYVGRRDPRPGPPRVASERLELGQSAETWSLGRHMYHLIELAPSTEIHRGALAAAAVRLALDRGELPDRSRRSLRTWVEMAPSRGLGDARQAAIAWTIAFLDGKKLEDAPAVFATRYLAELRAQPPFAALHWLKALAELYPVTLVDEAPNFLAPTILQRLEEIGPPMVFTRGPNGHQQVNPGP